MERAAMVCVCDLQVTSLEKTMKTEDLEEVAKAVEKLAYALHLHEDNGGQFLHITPVAAPASPENEKALLSGHQRRVDNCERDRSGERERIQAGNAEENLKNAVMRCSRNGFSKKQIRAMVTKAIKP
jgi:hypothetical protein